MIKDITAEELDSMIESLTKYVGIYQYDNLRNGLIELREQIKTEFIDYRRKLGKLFDILEKYSFLPAEIYGMILRDFILMEDGRKPLTEIEIYKHCEHGNKTREEIELCWNIGCDKRRCKRLDTKVIETIKQFKNELEKFGYYVKLGPTYNLIVSKNKELTEIIVNAVPPYRHVIARGLAFGYPEYAVISYAINEYPNEVEDDLLMASRVEEIVSMYYGRIPLNYEELRKLYIENIPK